MVRFVPSDQSNKPKGFEPPVYTPTPAAPQAQSSPRPAPQSLEQGGVFVGDFRPDPGEKFRRPRYVSRSAAERQWLNLSPERRADIDRLAKSIDYRSTGRGLYVQAVGAAEQARSQGMNVTPSSIINQLQLDLQGQTQDGSLTPSGGRRGRTAAYTGPVSSVTQAAESDIRASANAVAIELLGRGVTEDEFKKIEKRIRSAEMSQPQVTTRQGPGMQITEQGLSAQGREDILRQVLAKNPDFVDYQLDTTVMDLMLEDIERGKRVANV